MKRFGFITNKYVVSGLILLCLLLADIMLHRGMSRVIIPSSFTDKIKPANLATCIGPLEKKEKHWIKAVNNIELMLKLPANTAGIECDLYFDILQNRFLVIADSAKQSDLNIDSLLGIYASRNLHANAWFDIKNLSAENVAPSLQEINRLKNKYDLNNKIIIASRDPQFLKSFCDAGYYTGYTVPLLDPYKATENELIQFATTIKNNLIKYPASAIAGYYFQYPALKKYFPNYPILTWSDNSSVSIVYYTFKRQLENDDNIKVILYPFTD